MADIDMLGLIARMRLVMSNPVLVLAFLLVSCGGGGDSTFSPALCSYTYCGTLDQHSYVVYEPKGLAANAPMLILLHGASVPLDATESMWEGRAFADRYAYRLVIPQGQGNIWNYTDDVTFIAHLIDTVQSDRGASRAVFVAGWSNGAMLSQILACDHAERITAVVSLAGPLQKGRACAPSRPIGVALMGGSADTLIPLSGGVLNLLSQQDAFTLWSGLAHCSGKPVDSAPIALEQGRPSVTTTASSCQAPVQETVMQDAVHKPVWDSAVLHPFLQDFFSRAAP
jgi:polyhydroxybutyrate depolymerase